MLYSVSRKGSESGTPREKRGKTRRAKEAAKKRRRRAEIAFGVFENNLKKFSKRY